MTLDVVNLKKEKHPVDSYEMKAVEDLLKRANPKKQSYHKNIENIKIGVPSASDMNKFSVMSLVGASHHEAVKKVELCDVCPLEVARNMMVHGDKERNYSSYKDFDAVLFVDNDITYMYEDIQKVVESLHDYPIVAGLYLKIDKKLHQIYIWTKKGKAPYCWEEQGAAYQEYMISTKFPHRYVGIDRAGTGFLAVRRDVFERFDAEGVSYFEFVGKSECGGSEDFWFCDYARKFGFTIVADTHIRVGHVAHAVYF